MHQKCWFAKYRKFVQLYSSIVLRPQPSSMIVQRLSFSYSHEVDQQVFESVWSSSRCLTFSPWMHFCEFNVSYWLPSICASPIHRHCYEFLIIISCWDIGLTESWFFKQTTTINGVWLFIASYTGTARLACWITDKSLKLLYILEPSQI